MYQLLKLANTQQLLREVPALGISLIVAEMGFKFGSFSLEAIAFLALWFTLSLGINKIAENKH